MLTNTTSISITTHLKLCLTARITEKLNLQSKERRYLKREFFPASRRGFAETHVPYYSAGNCLIVRLSSSELENTQHKVHTVNS